MPSAWELIEIGDGRCMSARQTLRRARRDLAGFSPGANQTTSRIGPPSRCVQPQPAVTIEVWPSGCVCHAVRAPGSKVTLAPCTNAGLGARKSGSMRTAPVTQSDGPFAEGWKPALWMFMFLAFSLLRLIRTQKRLDCAALVPHHPESGRPQVVAGNAGGGWTRNFPAIVYARLADSI